ncbi:23S rRNA-/tRNA-specific pseudouridylate synthase [Klebsiella sp. SORGH_AS 826]|nr:23S rRNA-/tRNA-specific pseudouridylate synthase [Klebsiella sp. SORGH_AS_0826]
MAMENYNPPQDPWLVILYQDEHIMVVNKPSGLLSVPGRLEEHKDSVMTRIQRDFPPGRIGASPGYGHQRRDCGGAE